PDPRLSVAGPPRQDRIALPRAVPEPFRHLPAIQAELSPPAWVGSFPPVQPEATPVPDGAQLILPGGQRPPTEAVQPTGATAPRDQTMSDEHQQPMAHLRPFAHAGTLVGAEFL